MGWRHSPQGPTWGITDSGDHPLGHRRPRKRWPEATGLVGGPGQGEATPSILPWAPGMPRQGGRSGCRPTEWFPPPGLLLAWPTSESNRLGAHPSSSHKPLRFQPTFKVVGGPQVLALSGEVVLHWLLWCFCTEHESSVVWSTCCSSLVRTQPLHGAGSGWPVLPHSRSVPPWPLPCLSQGDGEPGPWWPRAHLE